MTAPCTTPNCTALHGRATVTCRDCGDRAFTGPGAERRAWLWLWNHRHESRPWRERALDAVRQLAATGEPFDFSDVTAICGDSDQPRSDHGSLMDRAHRLGLVVQAGWDESQRPDTKRSSVKLWRGAPNDERNVA